MNVILKAQCFFICFTVCSTDWHYHPTVLKKYWFIIYSLKETGPQFAVCSNSLFQIFFASLSNIHRQHTCFNHSLWVLNIFYKYLNINMTWILMSYKWYNFTKAQKCNHFLKSFKYFHIIWYNFIAVSKSHDESKETMNLYNISTCILFLGHTKWVKKSFTPQTLGFLKELLSKGFLEKSKHTE